MKKGIFAVASLLAIFFSQAATAGVRENGGRLAATAVEIQFGSIGGGADFKLREEIKVLIEEFQVNGEVKVLTEKKWGREGESTLCVEFNEYQISYDFFDVLEELVTPESPTSYELKFSCDSDFVIPPNV